jgi:uncharacterized membrane protein AbrB (regulator of aidB expression)
MDNHNSRIVAGRSLVLFFATALVVTVIGSILRTPIPELAFAAIGTGIVTVLSDWQKRRQDK